MHRHHIVPKHAGGTDDPSNIVEVTVEQHAELHLHRYLCHGEVGDWVAAMTLSGQIGREEARAMACADSNRQRVWTEEMRQKTATTLQGNSNAAGHSPSAEIRAQWSAKRRGRKWWHRGEEETQAYESPGADWVRGRKKSFSTDRVRNKAGRYT